MKQSEAKKFLNVLVFNWQKARSNISESLNPGELPTVKSLDTILWDDKLLEVVDKSRNIEDLSPMSFWNIVLFANKSTNLEIMMILDGNPIPEWSAGNSLAPWDPE